MNSKRIIYLVGASGSGKDTLLMNLRDVVNIEQLPVLFAHRYITRPVEQFGENHICLSIPEFIFRQKNGFFAMHWQSHGNYYGIGCEINEWLKSNSLVIINGSREYIPKALERYPHMQICLLQTSLEKLQERLILRGRESMDEIKERLNRASEFSVNYPSMVTLNNDGPIENTKMEFIEIITDLLGN